MSALEYLNEIDPAWLLVGGVAILLIAATIVSWAAIRRGEAPPLEPDNSIIQGRGDWAKDDET